MNVSSLVVRARPDACAAVRAALERMPGVEVSAASSAGQFVVVTDHDNTAAAADTFVAIHAIEGVLAVSLVYEYSDDAHDSEEG